MHAQNHILVNVLESPSLCRIIKAENFIINGQTNKVFYDKKRSDNIVINNLFIKYDNNHKKRFYLMNVNECRIVGNLKKKKCMT